MYRVARGDKITQSCLLNVIKLMCDLDDIITSTKTILILPIKEDCNFNLSQPLEKQCFKRQCFANKAIRLVLGWEISGPKLEPYNPD